MRALLLFKALPLIALAILSLAIPITAQNILVQPYLQLATPSSIVIMWETDVNTESLVHYGTTTTLGNIESGNTLVTLNNTILHSAALKGLTPGTRYFYKAITGNWESAIYDFVTPPLRNSEAPLNIVLMSDMQKDGGNPNIFSTLINTSLLPYIDTTYGSPLSEHLQMALLPGDVVDNGNTYGQWKNDFFDPGQALWRSVPCYPAIGNHEANSPNYFNYYTLPTNGTPGYLEHWYYHDYSNVRVISINSNPGYRIQVQLDWLDSILTLSCADTLIDFVFAEMHHPFKSELWTPGEADYTGDVVERMEAFSDTCGKPTIHFFGHTHAYSRGQSRDHEHLWVNVATSGGNIDYWGEFSNQDYDEFIVSQDEYGFVMVEVTAGADPKFVMKRLSFGDQYNPGGATEKDYLIIRMNNTPPQKPFALFPKLQDTVSAVCFQLKADGFSDPDEDQHGSTHWQISSDSAGFSNPVKESWKQYANWYNEINTQAGDDLTDEDMTTLEGGEDYWWRVRYRDKSLAWSEWSTPVRFWTKTLDTLSSNILVNTGAETGITSWTATTGVIESVGPGECDGISPYVGDKYFAVGGICINHAYASAYQEQDVSNFAGPIDSGNVIAHFGAYMADWQNTDRPAMALQFLSASNTVIGATDTMSHMQSAWTLKQRTDMIPTGTRKIRAILMGTRTSGADNDSYIDSVFCQLISGDFSCTSYVSPGPTHHRIYVDKNALAFPDGESWATAYRSPGEALLQSNVDTTIQEMWIAKGIYPVSASAQRDTSFEIHKGVRIYGGFAGTEESVGQRNLNLHQTTLSGEAGDTTLNTDNVYHVVNIGNTNDTVVLDGIHICCGFANGPADTLGGGLVIKDDNLETILLKNCVLEGNFAAEGSNVHNQGVTVIDSTIIANDVIEGLTGSAIINSGPQAMLTLINSTITQECVECPRSIINRNGAALHIRESVIIERN